MRVNNSTIAMGDNGYPLFWKSWPEVYREAWLIGLRKRVNERLGFDLNEIVSEVVAKLKADQAKRKNERARIEREKFREQIRKWDREAALASAMNEAARRLNINKTRPAVRSAAPIRKVTR